ncbi:MAG TPA: glycosyltransferase family 9 protein [Bryobacteraceae bacterium]
MNRPLLVVRLGAMGDIIHALPAVASLKQSFPQSPITWVVAEKWTALLEGNPYLDRVIPLNRKSTASLRAVWRELRDLKPAIAIDFQGLLQSALVGRASAPDEFIGLDRSVIREKLAVRLYTQEVLAYGPHRVERNLQLAQQAGAHSLTEQAWIPPGKPEGELPNGAFVLANPFAGWVSKQWPIDRYEELARMLEHAGLSLVVNVPHSRAQEVQQFARLKVHVSGIPGLIDATRRATAVVGLDSGPLHLAAALGKPGVAIYGPTDPAQNGPFKSRLTVLRAENVRTTYQRDTEIHPSMRQITVDQVAAALIKQIDAR